MVRILGEIGGFARVAIHLAELHPDVDLPQALVEVAIGRTRTVSLPGWNWALLMRTDQTYATPKLTFDSATSSGKGAEARRDAPNGALILERDLRKALAEPQATGRKLTPAVALERLKVSSARPNHFAVGRWAMMNIILRTS